jgi:hypothetical protein
MKWAFPEIENGRAVESGHDCQFRLPSEPINKMTFSINHVNAS